MEKTHESKIVWAILFHMSGEVVFCDHRMIYFRKRIESVRF